MSRYLNEIRLGEEKRYFRDIMRDVQDEFDISSPSRPVPHITLFGPYNTKQGHEVKRRTQEVLSKYSVVPYRVRGFGSFKDSGVVYADVEPSEELQEMRRDLADALEPVTTDYRPWDLEAAYDFHITIATGLHQKRARVLEYVRREYNPEMELHAKRVTALDGRDMMWEWDLPRGVELSSQEATSRDSWKKTVAALNHSRTEAQTGVRAYLRYAVGLALVLLGAGLVWLFLI